MDDNQEAVDIDCSRLKKPELIEILKKRGITSTGYKREDLIPLAEQALTLYQEKEKDDELEQAAKRRKVIVDSQETSLPDPAKIKTWTNNLGTLPCIESGHVVAFAGKYSR